MTSVTQNRGRLGNLLGLLAAGMAYQQNEYRPKFCRTRNCSLAFEHDGAHDGAPTAQAGPVVSTRRETHPVAGAARAEHRRTVADSRKFSKRSKAHTPTARSYSAPQRPKSPRHVNANPRGYATREHMAALRRNESPTPMPVPQSPGRRQEILARRAVTR